MKRLKYNTPDNDLIWNTLVTEDSCAFSGMDNPNYSGGSSKSIPARHPYARITDDLLDTPGFEDHMVVYRKLKSLSREATHPDDPTANKSVSQIAKELYDYLSNNLDEHKGGRDAEYKRYDVTHLLKAISVLLKQPGLK